MFKFLAKILAFLVSPKAKRALDTADQVVDVADKLIDKAKDAQRKLPKAK
jgi:hypothetical protein